MTPVPSSLNALLASARELAGQPTFDALQALRLLRTMSMADLDEKLSSAVRGAEFVTLAVRDDVSDDREVVARFALMRVALLLGQFVERDE